jgi:aldehyde dehydrogenase (NAD+)
MSSTIKVSGIEVPTGLYIGGEWVKGNGEALETINPATEEVLGSVQTATLEDVDRAVAAARDCFEHRWGLETSGTERGALMFKLADKVDESTEELATLESLGKRLKPVEITALVLITSSRYTSYLFRCPRDIARQMPESLLHGAKPISQTSLLVFGTTRVSWSLYTFYTHHTYSRFHTGAADKIHGTVIEIDDKSKHAVARKEPIGVCAQICPWVRTTLYVTRAVLNWLS